MGHLSRFIKREKQYKKTIPTTMITSFLVKFFVKYEYIFSIENIRLPVYNSYRGEIMYTRLMLVCPENRNQSSLDGYILEQTHLRVVYRINGSEKEYMVFEY